MSLPRRISVVIPVHNRPSMVAEAVESVMIQRGFELQIVVVDDGSTDDTAEAVRALVASGHPVTFAQHEANRGVAAARNSALRRTTMPLIGFLDSDDLLLPGAYEALWALLDEGYDLAHGIREDIATSEDCATAAQAAGVPATALCLSGALARSELVSDTGWFDEDLRVGEDHEWFARIPNLAQRTGLHPAVTLHRRLGEDNLTADPEALRRGRLAWVRKRLSQTPPR